MMKFNIVSITIIISFVCNFSLSAQTYYFEPSSSKSQNSSSGFYITLGNDCCYESDANGYDIGSTMTGSFILKYKGIQNGEHKYSGISFWDNSAFYFSSDYSRLRVKEFKNGNEYYFTRLSNTGKESSHKKYLESLKQLVYSAMGSSPMPGNTLNGTTSTSGSNNSNSSQSICRSCGGTGICTACHGAGGYWVSTGTYTGSNNRKWEKCGVCHGTGRCGVCYGKGSL